MTDHRSSTALQKVTDRTLAVCLVAVMIVIFTGCKVSGAENLSRCADIRALTREQAAEGRPVLLRGLITSGQKRRGAFVLQDDSEAIYVTPGQVDPALHGQPYSSLLRL